jgi:hypothetical protein
MKIKWVEAAEVEAIRVGKKPNHNLTPFIEELYANPMQWAEFPEKVNTHSWGYRQMSIYNEIEVVQTGGNNLPATHPNKKAWTVYMRYNPGFQGRRKQIRKTK